MDASRLDVASRTQGTICYLRRVACSTRPFSHSTLGPTRCLAPFGIAPLPPALHRSDSPSVVAATRLDCAGLVAGGERQCLSAWVATDTLGHRAVCTRHETRPTLNSCPFCCRVPPRGVCAALSFEAVAAAWTRDAPLAPVRSRLAPSSLAASPALRYGCLSTAGRCAWLTIRTARR